VYYQAIRMVGELCQVLPEPDADLMPERIMALLGESMHGYLSDLVTTVAPHLPQDTLTRWDGNLKEAIAGWKLQVKTRKSDCWFYSITSQWTEMRQTIATARGDIDLLVGLEEKKQPHMQDTLGIAAQLLQAGRASEALDWVRKPGQRRFDDADGDVSPVRVSLEARILEALDDKLPRRLCGGAALRPCCPLTSCANTSNTCQILRTWKPKSAPMHWRLKRLSLKLVSCFSSTGHGWILPQS
jgi:hypothetical protein